MEGVAVRVEDSGLFVGVYFVDFAVYLLKEFGVLDWGVCEEILEGITGGGGVIDFESEDGFGPFLELGHFLT